MLRPVLPAVRPFRSGAICLFLAVTLGLSAGTLGPGRRAARVVGPDVGQDARRDGGGDARLGRRRRSPGTVGAHILAVFLFIAGVLLLTGASVAGVIKFTSDSVLDDHARAAHGGGGEARRGRPTTWPTLERSTRVRVERPEVVRRDARVRARPSPSGRRRRRPPEYDDASGRARSASRTSTARADRARARAASPSPSASPELDGLAEDPAEDEPGVTRGPVGAGRARAAHAAGPLPPRRHRLAGLRLGAAGRRQAHALHRGGLAPRHRRPGEGRRAAARGARALQHRGARDRDGLRPAHHALRAAPGARHQGRQGRAAQGRPRVRARRGRHPHPGADPGQAGGRHRGAQRAPPDRPPRRHLPGAAGGLVAADGVARQGRRGARDRRRPGEDAAPAGRRHHRRGQVGRVNAMLSSILLRRRRTRCGWCSSTPSRSSSRTTTRSRTC